MKLNIIDDTFIKEKIKQMNQCHFAYVSIGYQRSIDTDMFGCFTNSDWMNHYNEEKLYNYDPLLEAGDKLRNQPIPWNGLSLCTKKKALVMNLRYELAHINTGITICTSTKNGIKRVLAIGDCGDEYSMLQKYEHSQPLFNSFYHEIDLYMQEKYV